MRESNRKTVKDRGRLISQGKGREIERRLERGNRKDNKRTEMDSQRDREGDKITEEEQEKHKHAQFEQAIVRMYNI